MVLADPKHLHYATFALCETRALLLHCCFIAFCCIIVFCMHFNGKVRNLTYKSTGLMVCCLVDPQHPLFIYVCAYTSLRQHNQGSIHLAHT